MRPLVLKHIHQNNMNNSKINKAILSYATSKTYEEAIMLTAEWGAGKSYYLQTDLVPFLKEFGIKTLVVSLHGLKSEFEISKAIYVEHLLSHKKVKKKRKHLFAKRSAALAVKTIVKGVANYFNVDLSCSEKDLEKIYKSIDLSKTLVIFEDVERAKMPADELLAYINNLVEYDHVKVLLITYEKELESKENNQDAYKNIKEKTVGDTLQFTCDSIVAINNMIKRFQKERTRAFFEKTNVDSCLSKEIVKEFKGQSINLRSIMFGLEKFNEIVSSINEDIDFEYGKNVLISCLLFVHKYRKDNSITWSDGEDSSTKLGSYNYPLDRFVYDFIVTNDFNAETFLGRQNEFKKYLLISKAQNELNKQLNILYNCYLEKENDVKAVIAYLRDSLKQEGVVPFELYFKIANYLIFLKNVLDSNEIIDDCLDLMLSNLKPLSEEQLEDLSYFGGIALDGNSVEEYRDFKNKAIAIIKNNRMNPLDFSYNVSDVDSFCESANKSKDSYYTKRSFASYLDMGKLVDLLKECSAFQINEIRGIFINIYSPSNIKEFFENDTKSLNELRDGVETLLAYDGFDNIQKQQIKYFINNLDEILVKLERGY